MPIRPALTPRLVRLMVAAGLFAALVLIALFVRDPFVRPTGGDVLVVAFLYFLVRATTPATRAGAAVGVFLFAVVVEATQAAGLVESLGLAGNAVAVTLLGHVFDPKDIAAYFV